MLVRDFVHIMMMLTSSIVLLNVHSEGIFTLFSKRTSVANPMTRARKYSKLQSLNPRLNQIEIDEPDEMITSSIVLCIVFNRSASSNSFKADDSHDYCPNTYLEAKSRSQYIIGKIKYI